MSTQRPVLAEVLAALCAMDDVAWWSAVLPKARYRYVGAGVEWYVVREWSMLSRWRYVRPADALAALVEAGLLPERWMDPDAAPLWHIVQSIRCASPDRSTRGAGFAESLRHDERIDRFVVSVEADPSALPRDRVTVSLARDGIARSEFVDVVDATDPRAVIDDALMTLSTQWPEPATNADLVAVASLGLPTLAAAHEHADTLAHRVSKAPRATVAWRAMGRDDFAASGLHALHGFDGVRLRYCGDGASGDAVVALRGLGLHLLNVRDGRVTLGLEALP